MNAAPTYHFIGLDIHKKAIVFCEKDVFGSTVAQGRIAARKADLVQFAQSRTRPWVGAMEATLFSGWIWDTLSPYAEELRVGHPLRLKRLSKNKNDKVDAKLLADLLRADLFPACHMAPPEVRELRRVLRYRNFLVIEATRMKNKVAGILMETGVQYHKSKLHQKKYFSELLDTLEEIPSSVRELLRMTRTNVELFATAQRRLLEALTQHVALHDRIALLKTIGGVGDVMALTWALEIDDPHRFASIKDVQSYCGLCSADNTSADKSHRGPLSKERNPHLQTILIEAAKLAPARYPYLQRVHEASLGRSTDRNRATLAVARKLAAYLLAVDKSGMPFVPPQ